MTGDSEQIKAIRQRYKQSFVEKAALIETRTKLLNRCAAEELAEHLLDCRAELHKLAGSSGMYGYEDVCELSRRAMHNIDSDELTDLKITSSQLHKLLLRHGNS